MNTNKFPNLVLLRNYSLFVLTQYVYTKVIKTNELQSQLVASLQFILTVRTVMKLQPYSLSMDYSIKTYHVLVSTYMHIITTVEKQINLYQSLQETLL